MKTYMIVSNETETGIKCFNATGKSKAVLAAAGFKYLQMGIAGCWAKACEADEIAALEASIRSLGFITTEEATALMARQ